MSVFFIHFMEPLQALHEALTTICFGQMTYKIRSIQKLTRKHDNKVHKTKSPS